jgi:hypothetical protein
VPSFSISFSKKEIFAAALPYYVSRRRRRRWRRRSRRCRRWRCSPCPYLFSQTAKACVPVRARGAGPRTTKDAWTGAETVRRRALSTVRRRPLTTAPLDGPPGSARGAYARRLGLEPRGRRRRGREAVRRRRLGAGPGGLCLPRGGVRHRVFVWHPTHRIGGTPDACCIGPCGIGCIRRYYGTPRYYELDKDRKGPRLQWCHES